MKRILLASVAALGLAGTASAADLAVRAPVPVPLFSWTGCYLGINGGWIGGNDDYATSRRILYGFGDPDAAQPADVALLSVLTAAISPAEPLAVSSAANIRRAGSSSAASGMPTGAP